MCRNITELRGLEPPATREEIEAAARQFVRKVTGVAKPNPMLAGAFDDAAARDRGISPNGCSARFPRAGSRPRRCRPCAGRRCGPAWGFPSRSPEAVTRASAPPGLRHVLVGAFAHGRDRRDRARARRSRRARAGGSPKPVYITRRSRSTGGCDMWSVQLQCTVTSPVSVGRSTIGRSELLRTNAGCTSARCEPATTRSWPDRASAPVTEMPTVRLQQLYECMPSEQSLCHGTSEMPFDDTDRLHERLDAVAGPAGRVAVAGEVPDPRELVAVEKLDGGRRVLVEVLHAHAAVGAVGGLRPPRAPVVAPVGRERAVHVGRDPAHGVGIEPAAEVHEAGFGEEVRDVGVVVVGAERPVQIERRARAVAELEAPGGVRARPSISERSTTHQSRKSPRLPRAMSSVPAVTKVIGVLRSLTMSATSASDNRTHAAPVSPRETVSASPSSASVHAPDGVSNVKGSTPSSRAPGSARSARSAARAGQLVVEERPAWRPIGCRRRCGCADRARPSLSMVPEGDRSRAGSHDCRGPT